MENKIEQKKEASSDNRKTSKSAVAIFIFAILVVISFVFTPASYSNLVSFLIGMVFNALLLWLAFFIYKRVVRKNLVGAKIAKISLYALSAVFVLGTIGSLVLVKYNNSLKAFAIGETPRFFTEDLSGLKINSTEELKKVISYEKETTDMKAKILKAGVIKECLQESKDVNSVSFGFSMEFNKLVVGLRGNYSVRCYGENKAFDFQAITKYEGGKWLVDWYSFDAEISKNFDYQENKDNAPSAE